LGICIFDESKVVKNGIEYPFLLHNPVNVAYYSERIRLKGLIGNIFVERNIDRLVIAKHYGQVDIKRIY